MIDGVERDFFGVVISRTDVESGDISGTLARLNQLLSPEAAIRYCEKVDIGVHGYDTYAGELNELPEIREFVYKLDAEFP